MKTTINSTYANYTSDGNIQNTTESILVATILVMVMLLSLLGNSLVLIAFYRFQRLRIVTNYFVVSLACADILITIFSIPYWIFHRIQELNGNNNHFRTVFYYTWQFIDILCCSASIVNLCLISVDRYVAVNSPLTYFAVITSKRACYSIAGAWCYSIACSSLSLIVPLVSKSQRATAGRIFAILISFAVFFVPLLILLTIYGNISGIALKHVRRINVSDTIVNHGLEKERRMRIAGELKLTKTLALVVGGFLICWGPFFTLVIFFAVCRHCPNLPFAVNISYWLRYLNSIMNPIVYAVCNVNFRHAFLRILTGGKTRSRWQETRF